MVPSRLATCKSIKILNVGRYVAPVCVSIASPHRCTAGAAFTTHQGVDIPVSHYNGVAWHRNSSKWQVRVHLNGIQKNIGLFDSSWKAAVAYDDALRHAGLRAKDVRRLNFPTAEDMTLCTRELESETRCRDRQLYGTGVLKEAAAKILIGSVIASTTFEVKWLGEGTLADGIVRPRASAACSWMALQVKSALVAKQKYHKFSGTGRYAGMLIMCVAVDSLMLWVVPGHVAASSLAIVSGGKWDVYKCCWNDMNRVLEKAWTDVDVYTRKPESVWRQPQSKTQRVERLGHDLGEQLLTKAKLSVDWPFIEQGPFDMLVNGDVRVQCKTRKNVTASVCLHLQRCAGRNACRPYHFGDFDALMVTLLRCDHLAGLFVFPTFELIRKGLLGNSALRNSIVIYAPWSSPKTGKALQAKQWQMQYYFCMARKLGEQDFSDLRHLFEVCRRVGSQCYEFGPPCPVASVDGSQFSSFELAQVGHRWIVRETKKN